MVEHDATAERGVRVDVDLEDLRDLRLQVLRQNVSTGIPQNAGRPVRLQRVESLKVQKDVGQRVAGRIAVADGHHVGSEIASERRTGLQCVVDESLQLRRDHHGGALQTVGQQKGQ